MADPPVTQSNANSDIISTKNAARLPDKIQSFLNSLDRAELRALRASLSKHWHFDFLELPLELRMTIYGYIFEIQGSQSKSTRLARKTRYTARSDTCSTAILSTCRQIHQEASNLLYRLHSAKIIVNQKATKLGNQFKSIDVAASTGFTRLDIDIFVDSSWLYIEYGQKKTGTLGHMLSSWADMLVSALQSTNTGGSRTINMNICLDGWYRGRNTVRRMDDSINQDWAKICWFRVQTAAALQEMRQDLQSRLPVIAFTITSEVEVEYSWLRVVRESALKLSCYQSSARICAHMSMAQNGALHIEIINS